MIILINYIHISNFEHLWWNMIWFYGQTLCWTPKLDWREIETYHINISNIMYGCWKIIWSTNCQNVKSCLKQVSDSLRLIFKCWKISSNVKIALRQVWDNFEKVFVIFWQFFHVETVLRQLWANYETITIQVQEFRENLWNFRVDLCNFERVT